MLFNSEKVDEKFYNHCLTYFTPSQEYTQHIVRITETTPNGVSGIGDNAFFLQGSKHNSFKIGDRYFITRSPDKIDSPIIYGPRKKENVETYNKLPDHRDYPAWGRVGEILRFNSDDLSFVIRDRETNRRYFCHIHQYAGYADETEEELESVIPELKYAFDESDEPVEIIYHRLDLSPEGQFDEDEKGKYQLVRWFPAADEGEGYTKFVQYIIREGYFTVSDDKVYEMPWEQVMDEISTDPDNLWRQCVRRLYDPDYTTEQLNEFYSSC